MLYYRVYDGANHLLVSTKDFNLARQVLSHADCAAGPYQFYVGGYLDGVAFFPNEADSMMFFGLQAPI